MEHVGHVQIDVIVPDNLEDGRDHALLPAELYRKQSAPAHSHGHLLRTLRISSSALF